MGPVKRKNAMPPEMDLGNPSAFDLFDRFTRSLTGRTTMGRPFPSVASHECSSLSSSLAP